MQRHAGHHHRFVQVAFQRIQTLKLAADLIEQINRILEHRQMLPQHPESTGSASEVSGCRRFGWLASGGGVFSSVAAVSAGLDFSSAELAGACSQCD